MGGEPLGRNCGDLRPPPVEDKRPMGGKSAGSAMDPNRGRAVVEKNAVVGDAAVPLVPRLQ